MVCVKIEQRVFHWDQCWTDILPPNVKGKQFVLKAHFVVCDLERGIISGFLFWQGLLVFQIIMWNMQLLG